MKQQLTEAQASAILAEKVMGWNAVGTGPSQAYCPQGRHSIAILVKDWNPFRNAEHAQMLLAVEAKRCHIRLDSLSERLDSLSEDGWKCTMDWGTRVVTKLGPTVAFAASLCALKNVGADAEIALPW